MGGRRGGREGGREGGKGGEGRGGGGGREGGGVGGGEGGSMSGIWGWARTKTGTGDDGRLGVDWLGRLRLRLGCV
jgi:hypothetical protein